MKKNGKLQLLPSLLRPRVIRGEHPEKTNPIELRRLAVIRARHIKQMLEQRYTNANLRPRARSCVHLESCLLKPEPLPRPVQAGSAGREPKRLHFGFASRVLLPLFFP